MATHNVCRAASISLALFLAVSSGCASMGNSVDALFGVPVTTTPRVSSTPTEPPFAAPANGVMQASATQPFAGGAAGPSTPQASAAQTAQLPSFLVRIQPTGGKAMETRLPLTNETYVQDVLEQSQALERFRRVKLQIWRPLAQGHHKLDIAFDRDQRRVPPAFDYAIHPGDRLIITEDDTNVVDDMLSSLPLPFARTK